MGLYDSPGGINISRWHKICLVDHDAKIALLIDQVDRLNVAVMSLIGAVDLLAADYIVDLVPQDSEEVNALRTDGQQALFPAELGGSSGDEVRLDLRDDC